MIDLKLTTAEAIALQHELGLMEVLLSPKTADEIKLELLKYERSPEAISGYRKLTAELDKLAETQRQLFSEGESDRND